mmetsp:Transcript_21090/g.51896  ORF Transcript_21090/g.51896 Transcript_21090/m.51896 type:complete len:90 (+) Transcript_21090:237-506(+)
MEMDLLVIHLGGSIGLKRKKDRLDEKETGRVVLPYCYLFLQFVGTFSSNDAFGNNGDKRKISYSRSCSLSSMYQQAWHASLLIMVAVAL